MREIIDVTFHILAKSCLSVVNAKFIPVIAILNDYREK